MFRAFAQSVADLLEYVTESFWLAFRALLALIRSPLQGRRVVFQNTMLQLLYTGTHAVVPVAISSIALGTLVIYQSQKYLPGEYAISGSTSIIVREVTPILVAFLLVGRSGTAITIEIGNMKLNDELGALAVMRIPLERYVTLPRWIGMVVSFGILQVYSIVAALVGGYYVAKLAMHEPPSFSLATLAASVSFNDMGVSVVKALLFGSVIAITSVPSATDEIATGTTACVPV